MRWQRRRGSRPRRRLNRTTRRVLGHGLGVVAVLGVLLTASELPLEDLLSEGKARWAAKKEQALQVGIRGQGKTPARAEGRTGRAQPLLRGQALLDNGEARWGSLQSGGGPGTEGLVQVRTPVQARAPAAGNGGTNTAGPRLRGQARVIDGDTIDVAGERVRLADIDAPEKDQPLGSAATRYLEQLIGGRPVEVVNLGRGQYGRIVGTVWVRRGRGEQPLDVNRRMVRAGFAHVNRQYTLKYAREEDAARRDRLGVHGAGTHEKPWEYRRRVKN